MGTGPWKLEKYTPNVGVTYTKNPDYWDKTRQPKPDRNEIKYYEKEEAGILGIQGGEVDVLAQFSRGQRQGAAQRSERQRHRAARLPAPPDAHAHGQGAVQRQARAPGGRAPDQPRQHRQGPDGGEGGLRQRQPVRAGLPVDGHVRPPAQAGRREGQGAAVRGRQEQHRRRAARPGPCSRCRSTPADPAGPQGRRHQREAQHHGRGHLLRRRGVRQVAVAGLDASASPSTATAACRTCSSARRCESDGTWNSAHFKNKKYDQLRRTTSRRSTCRRSGRRRRRSRSCCSTRCRSSSPTSTSTSRRRSRPSRASRCPPWARSTSPRRGRRPGGRPGRERQGPPSPASSQSASASA